MFSNYTRQTCDTKTFMWNQWYNLVLLLISPPTTHHLCDDSMSYAL